MTSNIMTTEHTDTATMMPIRAADDMVGPLAVMYSLAVEHKYTY